MSITSVTASITAQNTFSDPIGFAPGTDFLISVEGTFSATVTLQKTYDNGTIWYDQIPDGSFTGPNERICRSVDDSVKWRIGVKTGNFTSGTMLVRLSQ
jgi:hypothetical protein